MRDNDTNNDDMNFIKKKIIFFSAIFGKGGHFMWPENTIKKAFIRFSIHLTI